MTAYGNSVCLGKGLGRGGRPSDTWFEQTRSYFRVPGTNGAVVGTQWPGTILTQQQYPERQPWLQIFWGGHADAAKNRAATIPGNVQTLVDYCTGPYLILGTTNGHSGGVSDPAHPTYYQAVFSGSGSNAQLAATHGPNYIDVQKYLMTSALADAGITPTTTDQQYLANGQVPFSLLNPNGEVHLNLAGQSAVAQHLVIPYLVSAGWLG